MKLIRQVASGTFSGSLLAVLTLCQPACAEQPRSFTAERYARHIERLASDEFEGRRPASPGEDKTVAYIEAQFRAAGLRPHAGDSYRQPVPFIELVTQASPAFELAGGKAPLALLYGEDAVYWTTRPVIDSSIADSALVFVGYGIVEPAMGWNDYAGVDMRGKTAVILVNDPGFATGDAALFKGRAMTYHGRWTYKFAEAARQGAAAAIIVHETEAAAYPWAVVRNGAAKPQLIIDRPGEATERVALEGWMTRDAAVRTFATAGLDYDQLKASAAVRGFQPVPMPLRATASVHNQMRKAASSNVIGVLPGSERPDEFVLFTAHWDHLGKAATGTGDLIFNGAADNATGTAGVIELAHAFGALPQRPARSIAFVAFTGEEFGLLGSEYFAANSPFPVAKIAGGVNIDVMNSFGPARDLTVIGNGSSELEDYLAEAATRQGRVLAPDPTPERGSYYRSDHFNLAKQGVPMLYCKGGMDLVDGGVAAGRAKEDDYVANRYHKPGDEFSTAWNVAGALQDLQLYYEVGLRLSRESRFPQWYPGNEFRAIREASLAR